MESALESNGYRNAPRYPCKKPATCHETQVIYLAVQRERQLRHRHYWTGGNKAIRASLHWEPSRILVNQARDTEWHEPLLVGGGGRAASTRTAPYTACGGEEEDSRPRQRWCLWGGCTTHYWVRAPHLSSPASSIKWHRNKWPESQAFPFHCFYFVSGSYYIA